LLLDIPKLDSEITRCSSKSVLNNRMPSGVKHLLAVTLKLSVSLTNVLTKTFSGNNPKLASRVVGTGGKKLIVKRRELDIVDNTLVTVAKWDSHIKLLESFRLEAGKRTWAIPANSSELSIASNTIRVIFGGWDGILKLLSRFDTKEIFELKRCL